MFDDISYMAMAWSQLIFGPIILVSVLMPVIIYVIGRWRVYKDDSAPDPQLGMKVAICWFKITAYQLGLVAAYIILMTLLVDMPDFLSKQMIRLGAGIALPATLIFGVHEYALRQTNSEQRPAIKRMFNGVSLVLSGLFAFGGLIMGGILLFQENAPTELNRVALALVLVYVTAWVLQGLSLMKEVTGAFMPTATVTQHEARDESA